MQFDFKLCILAGKLFGRILIGEFDIDRLLFIILHTYQLLFKPGDELSRTDLELEVFRFTAFKRLTVNKTFEIDNRKITLSKHSFALELLIRRILFCQLFEFCLYLFRICFWLFELWHDIHISLKFRIWSGRDLYLNLDTAILFFVILFECRLTDHICRIDPRLFDPCIDKLSERFALSILSQLFTVHLLDDVYRHFPRSKAVYLDLLCRLFCQFVDCFVDRFAVECTAYEYIGIIDFLCCHFHYSPLCVVIIP